MQKMEGMIGRGGRKNFVMISFKSNRNSITSSRNQKKEIRLSPRLQGKQLPSYAPARDDFIHHIHKSYGQGGKDAINILMDMK